MKAIIRKATVGILLGCVFVGLIGRAQAQTPVAESIRERLTTAVQKLQAECAADLTKFCSMVTPGEGRLLFCMMAHEDKISTKCDYALYNASRNLGRALNMIEQAADVCWPDIEKYCGDIPEGGGRIAQCLMSKRSTLGQDCQTALDQLPATKQ
jgi:Golgi apparatus protein 1